MNNPIVTTCRRTFGHARNLYSSAWAMAGFLSCSAVVFAYQLMTSEGVDVSVVALWALSTSQVLPAFAAFIAMGIWSEERQSGRMDSLLSIPVMERSLVLGKFLGAWLFTMMGVMISLVSTFLMLLLLSHQTISAIRLGEVIAAIFVLAIQNLVWCAVSTALSAMVRYSAVALGASLLLLMAIPRGLWLALRSWTLGAGSSLGEMPFDTHVLDFTNGTIQLGVLLGYLLVSGTALFVASKCVALMRLVGKGAKSLRISSVTVMLLSVVFAVLAVRMLLKMPMLLDVPVAGFAAELSPRTHSILAESGGNFNLVAFLSRSDSRFRKVSQLLRTLKREAMAHGGGNVDVTFIDPRWDIGAAERIVREGVTDASVVFQRGRRNVVVSLSEGFDERMAATAIRRLITPLQRRNVYWTIGHGEHRFNDYGAFGMSDIAREMSRVGYANQTIELSSPLPIPGDCALVLIAGAKNDFSRSELERIDAYLKEGGRLLVLLSAKPGPGFSQLLSNWGMVVSTPNLNDASTRSGDDVIVSEFSEHPIASRLKGARVIFEKPLAIEPSRVVGTSLGADRMSFTPITIAVGQNLAAVAERGAKLGSDLAMRPTRLVAVGDASFVANSQLLERGNANRDLLLNAVAYLSGADAIDASGAGQEKLPTGMDRAVRLRHLVLSGVVSPMVVLVLMSLIVLRRRSRT